MVTGTLRWASHGENVGNGQSWTGEKRGHRPQDTQRRGGEERTEGRVLERSEKKLNGPKSCTLQIRAKYSAAIPAATGTLPLSPTPPYSSPHSECIHVSAHANTTTIPVTIAMHAHTKNNYGKPPIGQVISHSGLVRFRKANPG